MTNKLKLLCDHWNEVADHRCRNYVRMTIELTEPVTIHRSVMSGTYSPGTWNFCNRHGFIFQRDRMDNKFQTVFDMEVDGDQG